MDSKNVVYINYGMLFKYKNNEKIMYNIMTSIKVVVLK